MMNRSTKTQDIENQQELWAVFETAADSSVHAQAWLALQCSKMGAVSLAVLVLEDEDEDGYSPCALYPDGARDSQRLADLIDRSLQQKKPLWLKMEAVTPAAVSSLPVYALSYPLKVNEKIIGVVAVELPIRHESELAEAMQQLRWGMGWLQLDFWRRQAVADEKIISRLQPAVDLLARVLSETQFDVAALALVNEMAALFDCERVSIGFVDADQIQLVALSHSARFAQKMNLTRLLISAMDETLDQVSIIHWPQKSVQGLITRDHERLAAEEGSGTILSLPLTNNRQCYAVLMLERASAQIFSSKEIETAKGIACLAGAALDDKRRLELPLVKFVRQRVHKRQQSQEWGAYGLLGLVLFVIAFFSFVQGDYLLNADSVLEGAVQRVIAAPFTGFIEQAPARAGDVVKQGALLAQLDDRDLRLERIKWLSEQARLQKQSQDARARRQRAEVTILESQIAQSRAELQLVENRLTRTYLGAPFDGLIVSGDLSQRLGGAVQQGEVLFELAPLEAYRLILQVDESRITDVKSGQQGQLVLTALPDQSFPFVIEKITPVASAADGANRFRVEATLGEVAAEFRPGMEGIAKIQVDQRLLISIWSRNLREWLALQYWYWLG
ncbi:GAF domain protein [hydrothermal vent metagenome]|uniref:GAF domain protein n=1 Tax=hydrothermal vent metagenome TaxID=652676 RepID=A0A3B1ALL6_9ZZZZ